MSGSSVPPVATERLRAAAAGGPFGSSLGVAEALAVRAAGFEPIAQVMGSAVYKFGWQPQPGLGAVSGRVVPRVGETYELQARTDAYNEALRAAVDRLRDEARTACADAVVGVTVRRSRRDALTDLIEYVATGTAVRSTRYAVSEDGDPLLCNLSGQDVAKLVSHGLWPVGIVAGSTVAYAVSGLGQQRRSSGLFSQFANQELPDFSRGVSEARLLAMDRVERQAHALHAHGIVGVRIDRSQHDVERDGNAGRFVDLQIEVHVTGTAIVEVRHATPPPEIFSALPLS
jgi:uncharacterized protein YbjQ (UPF0145 family)